jgi:general L-amino acid transport system permease protein
MPLRKKFPVSHAQKLRWMKELGVVFISVSVLSVIFLTLKRNLSQQNISSGFSFLSQEAGFEIGESLISFQSSQSYLRALVVGLINTLKVALIGGLMSLILGGSVGLARVSIFKVLRGLSKIYVEVLRNIPLLLQLFFWYFLISEILPPVRAAFSPVNGVYLSNRGLFFPTWSFAGGLSVPTMSGFNFEGGGVLGPEFIALLVGLVLYTSSFIAEIVRAGIECVPRGQLEAGLSLGLSRWQILRLILIPQAKKVMVPPLTGQVLNLTKNSTLSVAIGYPDFVSITNTTINQTGQAVEGIFLIMVVYLTLSLLTSWGMKFYLLRRQG